MEMIRPYLSSEDWVTLERCLDFLRIKTAKVARRVEAVATLGEEEFVAGLCGVDIQDLWNYIHLCGMDGRFELTNRLVYYNSLWGRPNYLDFTSPEAFKGYQQFCLPDIQRQFAMGNSTCTMHGYLRQLQIHEHEQFKREGMRLWTSDKSAALYLGNVDRRNPSDAAEALKAALVMIGLEDYDRARPYVEMLKKFATMPYAGANSGALRPEQFRPMGYFAEALLRAKTALDVQEARRHAAQAIVWHFQAVVENYNDNTAGSNLLCKYPRFACSVAIDFEFDPDWGRDCCRAMLVFLYKWLYPALFFKARQWQCWMRPPEELGYLGKDEVDLIEDRERQKRKK